MLLLRMRERVPADCRIRLLLLSLLYTYSALRNNHSRIGLNTVFDDDKRPVMPFGT